jgi:hypothetical protein
MTEHLMNWFVDTMARTETLDLYFVISDLLDIPQSEIELGETTFGDAMAVHVAETAKPQKKVPIGKLVI